MKTGAWLLALGILLAAGCASSGVDRSWTKEEAVRWYSENSGSGSVRFVGYQGSDATQHHFIARVMDSWTFVQVPKEELQLPDERPFPSASSAQLYYYLVDPAHGFAKVESEKEANQALQPTAAAGRG